MTADVLDIGVERQRRGLPPPMLRIEPEPPPGLRRGDKVRLKWSGLTRDPQGDIGVITGHRWIPDASAGCLLLRLIVQTTAFTASCRATDLEILI